MRAPRVIRSKTRPVSSMMAKTIAKVRGTAAATTMPTLQPRLIRLTIITTASATKNFSMNSSTASPNVHSLIGDFFEADAGGQVSGDFLLFKI